MIFLEMLVFIDNIEWTEKFICLYFLSVKLSYEFQVLV